MRGATRIALFSALLLGAGPALGADVAVPDLGAVKAPGLPLAWSIGLEVSPEFHAKSKGPTQGGDYADTAIKASLGYTFDKSWVLNGSLQATLRQEGTEQYYGEGGVGYKFRFGDFTLTPQAALGDTWGTTGLGDRGQSSALYYALYLAGDLKLSDQWSWTMFNLRWRNAFDYEWQTPKVSMGLTYSFNDADKLSIGAGYSWKDTGSGMQPDKINASVTLKHAF